MNLDPRITVCSESRDCLFVSVAVVAGAVERFGAETGLGTSGFYLLALALVMKAESWGSEAYDSESESISFIFNGWAATHNCCGDRIFKTLKFV